MREKQLYLVFSALFVGVARGWSSHSRCFPWVQSRRRTSLSAATAAGVPDFSTPSVLRSSDAIATPTSDWIVYVDHSKPSLEKGAAATLDAFLGLTTAAATARSGRTATTVAVKAAFLPKPKKGGQPATPWVLCVSLANNIALEIYGVDSVDKVYRVLTKHMAVEASPTSCACFARNHKTANLTPPYFIRLFVLGMLGINRVSRVNRVVAYSTNTRRAAFSRRAKFHSPLKRIKKRWMPRPMIHNKRVSFCI